MRKLTMPLKYIHTARITYSYQFPIDMLRYDHCHPASELDSGRIMLHHPTGDRTEKQVEVEAYTATATPPWTIGRWQSFGCKVEVVVR